MPPTLNAVDRAIADRDLDLASSLLGQLPTDRDVELRRVRVHRLMGDPDAVRAIVDAHAGDDDFLTEKTLIAFSDGKNDPALEMAQDILKRNPRNERAIQIAAAVHRQQRQFDKAEALITEGLRYEPKSASLFAEKAALAAAQSRPAEAWTDLETALSLDPQNETALSTLAHFRNALHGHDVAALLTAGMQKYPRNPMWTARLAHVKLQDDPPSAAKLAADAVKRRPKWAMPRLIEIAALQEEGRRDDALLALADATRELPGDVRFRWHSYGILSDAGELEKAKTVLDEIEAIEGSTPEVVAPRIHLLRRSGAVKEARELCGAWREKSRDFPDLQSAIAYTYGVIGLHSMAIEYLDRFGNPDDQEVLAIRALVLFFAGKFAEADRIADQALRKHADDALFLALKAWLLGNNGKFREAEEKLAEAAAINPHLEQIATVRVELKLMQGEAEAAAELATEELKRHPDSVDLHMDLAQAEYARHEYDSALALVDQAIRRDRSMTMLVQMKAITLHRMGRTLEAIELLDKTAKTCPNSAGVPACLGYILLQSDDYPAKAEAQFRRALDAGAGGPMAYAGLAAIAYRARDYEEAEKWFSEVVKLQPFSLDARTNLAWTLTAAGQEHQLKKAEGLCLEILAVRPNHAGAIGCRGAIAHRREERRKAEWLFGEACKAAPDDVDMRVNLGAAQARLGKYKDAEETLHKAIEQEAAHPRALIELARLMIKQTRFEEARRFAQAAVDASPSIAASWRVLALTASAENRDSFAEEVLRRGIANVESNQRDALRVELARLLLKLAEPKPSDPRLRETIELLTKVIEVHPEASEALLLRGIAELRAERPMAAIKLFDRVKEDRLQGYVSGMRQAAAEMRDGIRQRIGPVEQYTLAGIVAAELISIWIAFLTNKGGLTAATFATLVPIATALLMVAMLLPRLSSLKVATVEAQLVLPPRDAQAPALVGPAADVDMTPALEPLVLAGFYAFDP